MSFMLQSVDLHIFQISSSKLFLSGSSLRPAGFLSRRSNASGFKAVFIKLLQTLVISGIRWFKPEQQKQGSLMSLEDWVRKTLINWTKKSHNKNKKTTVENLFSGNFLFYRKINKKNLIYQNKIRFYIEKKLKSLIWFITFINWSHVKLYSSLYLTQTLLLL